MKKHSDIIGKRIKKSSRANKTVRLIVMLGFAVFVVISIVKMEIISAVIGLIFLFAVFPKPGDTIGVLADDKLHFFATEGVGADFSVSDGGKMRTYSCDGWIRYYAIEEMKFEANSVGFDTVTIRGEGFELIFYGACENLIAEIEEKKAACRDYGIDGPWHADIPENDVVREGLWGEVFDYCERCSPAELVGLDDAQIKFIIHEDGTMNMVEILVTRGESGIWITFEEAGVTLNWECDNEELYTFGYEEVESLDDILARVRTWLADRI